MGAAPKKQQRQRHTGKKFSWKVYPELEEFLIIKREEYLSYSAKNYTIEQRDYNNRLTSMLLEHAEASGYSTLFESCTFSAVRDRIRSYYKSYVQSFKRRKERQEEQERLKKLEMDYVFMSKHNETKRFGETSCETTGHSQGTESILVESCDIRQAKARPGTQCQLHKNTSIHGQNHPGVTTWNLHTYLFFIRSTLSTQTSFDNCMAIRYRRLFRILRSQFWINFIGALLLYHTALSMERTDKRMQTHAHAHSHTHARVDITGRSLV